jgi:RNA polymerase sigma-70 factor (ECF subfamily)
MKRKEKILYKRAKNGDIKAAFLLIDMFYESIFSYFKRLCNNQQDAEDLTQKTFIKVWSSLDGYRPRGKFLAWIHTIAYRVYVDWTRRQKNKEIFLARGWWEICCDHNPNPFQTVNERAAAQQLYQAVDRLDNDEKQVIHLHYYQGLSLRETATAMNLATSTVKYRLRNAMKNLRSEINYDGEDDKL